MSGGQGVVGTESEDREWEKKGDGNSATTRHAKL